MPSGGGSEYKRQAGGSDGKPKAAQAEVEAFSVEEPPERSGRDGVGSSGDGGLEDARDTYRSSANARTERGVVRKKDGEAEEEKVEIVAADEPPIVVDGSDRPHVSRVVIKDRDVGSSNASASAELPDWVLAKQGRRRRRQNMTKRAPEGRMAMGGGSSEPSDAATPSLSGPASPVEGVAGATAVRPGAVAVPGPGRESSPVEHAPNDNESGEALSAFVAASRRNNDADEVLHVEGVVVEDEPEIDRAEFPRWLWVAGAFIGIGALVAVVLAVLGILVPRTTAMPSNSTPSIPTISPAPPSVPTISPAPPSMPTISPAPPSVPTISPAPPSMPTISPAPQETYAWAPWLSATEINDPVEYVQVYFSDGDSQMIPRSFGSSVSLSHDGNRVAVGSRFGDAFHVYERDSDKSIVMAEWLQLGSNILPPPHNFTVSNARELEPHATWVELSGDGNVVACGFPYYRTPVEGNNQKYDKWGAVVAYRYESGSWEQLGDPIIGENKRDFIGHAFALSEDGTVLALGESRDRGSTGRVRVLEYTPGSPGAWNQVGNDILGGSRYEEWGGLVSLSRDGSIVASGSLYGGDDGNGFAKVFRNSGGTWEQMGDTLYPNEGYTLYGWPVSISGGGTRLAVGSASFKSGGDISDGGLDKGYVGVYEYDTENGWAQLGDGMEGTEGGDGLGWSLSLSDDGTTIAAGASNSDFFGTDQGYAKVYRYLRGKWTQIGKDIEGSDVGGWTGSAISISANGEHLAVSTPFDYADNIASPGYVRIYQSPFNVTYINSRLKAENLTNR